MATTQEILKAAQELGKVIATHDSAKRFASAMQRLSTDTDAQRQLNDLQRHLAKLQEKEQMGQAIDVEDKRAMDKLQANVARNLVLREFQLAQMDYLDLMNKVDQAMAGEVAEEPPPISGASPLASGGLKLQ